jgi:hypothetical protein
MAADHVFWTLMPLEADKRNRSKMWFAIRDKRSMQGIRLGASRGPGGFMLVLKVDSAKGVSRRDSIRIEALHCVPSNTEPE